MDLNLEFKQYISIEVKLFCSLMVVLHWAPTGLAVVCSLPKAREVGRMC